MKKRLGNRKKWVRPLMAVTFVVLLAVVWVGQSAARILFSYGEHAAAAKAQAIFAETVKSLCETEAFSDAVSLETDETGSVKALFGNTALQNHLQATLAEALCEAFEQSDRVSFTVPMGTLLGDPLSSGHGPTVTFLMAMVGSPTVTLEDDFSAAGINQTYHTTTANAEITVLITALGKQKQTTLSLSVPVSQTVIAGDVPQFYAAF